MRTLLAAISTACLLTAGCYDPTPPPPRASVPPPGTYTQLSGAPAKPLPEPQANPYRPPFDDVPLVSQPTPEEGAFVDTYQRVGAPRMTLFVNRSLQGQIVPTAGGAGGGVQNPNGGGVYLAPGEYDEVAAKRIDYDAIENVMTDWLAADGKTTMISPHLTEAQISGLRNGDSNVLKQLGKDNNIDVLIQVQARPTQQTPRGLQIRLIAEAINTAGGESIGRAFVDVPPPLEKTTINDYTRFLARKLMSDMTRTWSNPRPENASPPAGQAPQPAPQEGPSALPPGSRGRTPPAPLQPSTQPLSPPASTQPIG